MTPEEYERYKNAEKEHLKKLKELKQAVRVLERQKKIRSTLQDMNRSSSDALGAQEETVERLARETAYQQAKLEIAFDAAAGDDESPPEELEEDLQRERARLLVEKIKASMDAGDRSAGPGPSEPEAAPEPSDRTESSSAGERTPRNPTTDRIDRPEKTIGRM